MTAAGDTPGLNNGLGGSDRPEPHGAAPVGDIDRDASLEVTLYLKRRSSKPAAGSEADFARLLRPISRQALDAERLRTHGRAADRIVKFAKANGLSIRNVDLTSRRIVLEAPASRMAEIFGASLRTYSDGQRTFRARSGALSMPRAIAPWTRAVLGFDQRAQAVNLAGDGNADVGLWPTEVAKLYNIPLDRDVSSQCVGIIALGGGYQPADLSAALAGMGRVSPTVVDASVSGVTNQYGDGTRDDEEIALDLQILAGLLPTARIVVYFAPNTTRGLADAVHQAVFDEVNRPQVLSISWGSAEKYWTPDGRDAVQAALQDAVRRQVSVVAAAGDELASSGVTDGKAHVWFPASSPYVLGCGGTAIVATGGAILSELVWNEGIIGTGGGISDCYPVPVFQSTVPMPPAFNGGGTGRGVPDVAALASKVPGYRIVLGNQQMAKDGTSAAAPLWGALIAMANAQRGAPVGFVNSILYATPGSLRMITQGNNQLNGVGYVAGDGWNACTGLGVPRGVEIIDALASVPTA